MVTLLGAVTVVIFTAFFAPFSAATVIVALPFADGEFDVVHCHQVLQHVGDPAAVLREMAAFFENE